MFKIRLTSQADQQFQVRLNGRRVLFRARWNETVRRWALDVAVDGEVKRLARFLVFGPDVLGPPDLGIGRIFVAPIVDGALPTRDAFESDLVGLFQATDEEIS